jgi:hypothetical protein
MPQYSTEHHDAEHKVKVKVKVTSLYMPERASQWKFEKSLKPHLAKQKKQKLEET